MRECVTEGVCVRESGKMNRSLNKLLKLKAKVHLYIFLLLPHFVVVFANI